MSGLFTGQFHSQKLAREIFWVPYISEVFIFKKCPIVLDQVPCVGILDFQRRIQLYQLTCFSTIELLVHLFNGAIDMRQVLGCLLRQRFQIRQVEFVVFSALLASISTLPKAWVDDLYRIIESQRLDWRILDHLGLFLVFSVSPLIFFLFIILVGPSGIIWNLVNVVTKILEDVLLGHDLIICRISQLGHCLVVWSLVHLAEWWRILMGAASAANAEGLGFWWQILVSLRDWSWACDGDCSASGSRSEMLRVKCLINNIRVVALGALVLVIDFALNNCLFNGR